MENYIKARGVVVRKDKIFLVKDKRCNKFILPGGTQELDETIKNTFYREMKEETGIDAIMGEYIGFKEYKNEIGTMSIQFLFLVENVDDFLYIDKDNCTHGHEWSEAGFYDIKELKLKGENTSDDLEDIFNSIYFGKKYEYLI